MQHQGGLSNSRRAANENQGTLDCAAAQDAIQFSQSSGKADLLVKGHFGDPFRHMGGTWCTGGFDDALPFGWGGLFHNGVPGTTGGALPLPLGELVAALGAVKNGFGLHTKDSPSCALPLVK